MTALQDVVNNHQSAWENVETWHIIVVCVVLGSVLFIAKNRMSNDNYVSKTFKEISTILFSLILVLQPALSIMLTVENMNQQSFEDSFKEAVIVGVESNFNTSSAVVEETNHHKNGHYATVELRGDAHTVISDFKYSEEFGMMIPYATDVEDMPEIKKGSPLDMVLATHHPSELDVNSIMVDDSKFNPDIVLYSTFTLVISWIITAGVVGGGIVLLVRGITEEIVGLTVFLIGVIMMFLFVGTLSSLHNSWYKSENIDVINYNIESQYAIEKASATMFHDGLDEVGVHIKVSDDDSFSARFYFDEETGLMKQYVNKNTEPLAVREE